MVKMHDIRRTKADVNAEKKAVGADKKSDGLVSYVAPEDEGARMEFDHHHLEKMGVGANLKSGDTVHFHGHGTVERSESRSEGGKERNSATIRFHHGGVDHEAADGERDASERGEIRKDIETAAKGKA